jgi:glucokinase
LDRNHPKTNRLIGVDIGGTKCAVCLGDAGARVLARREIATPRDPKETLAALERHARELLGKSGAIDAVGISCGGPLDAVRGLVLSPPNLKGWNAVPVAAYFRERFGAPAFLQNDANACALAEWRHGAGRGSRNMVFCTMGTGFGCGLILDGRLYEGANGNAGELGHVRLTPAGPVGYGKAGSVEGYCGGNGIAQLARIRLDGHRAKGGSSVLSRCETLSAGAVAEAARNGDELAAGICAEVGEMLGRALALVVDLLNPEIIVVGSIFARAEALLRPSMERAMGEEGLRNALQVCSVRAAELGDRIGDVAALTVALRGLETAGAPGP